MKENYRKIKYCAVFCILIIFGFNNNLLSQVNYTTPGTYTWTVPACVTSLTVQVWGGGGGGGGAIAIQKNSSSLETCAGAGGGGGGGYSSQTFAVTPCQTYTIIVGDGGIVGSSGNGTWNGGITTQPTVGGTGGTSSFIGNGINIIATGGTGGGQAGIYNTSTDDAQDFNIVGSGGTGGAGSGGTINYTGGNGAAGIILTFSTDKSGGGGGAAGPGGNGGNAPLPSSVGPTTDPPGGTGQSPGGNGGVGRYDNLPASITKVGGDGNIIGGGAGGGLVHRGGYGVGLANGGLGARGEVRLIYSSTGAVTPTFTELGPYCVGDSPGTLSTTSNNGIIGTWSPSTISTASAGTTVYTFTPTGCSTCANSTTMSVVVNANVTPIFTTLGPYCVGAAPGTLPATSLNGISGIWNPSSISTSTAGTTTYTFTPTAGQCAINTTMDVSVSNNITPTFTTLGPYCVGATPGTLPATSSNGISGTWNPSSISTSTVGTTTYTFTPTAGQCAINTTMDVTVSNSITPTFTALGPYCVGATPGTLPATSSNGISGTWNPSSISTSTAGTTTYTFTPTAGQCAINTTMNVTVSNNITPTFTTLGPYCVGATPGTLPATSSNGISGTWNPSSISTSTAGTTTYTFTPTAGQCAINTTMNVTVSNNITPTFTALGPYCVGATPGTLPATSSNGISGTWNPSSISTSTAGTATYTFTPTAGQCAINTTMNVTVSNNITPTFTALGPYCVGATPGVLPATSSNGISGTWNPSGISTSTAGTTTYTFTPTAGQCAINTTMNVTVSNNITPTFTTLGPYCVGATPGTLPATSSNGISGTWNPSSISTSTVGTTTYTFTPTAGQCAINTTMDVTVSNNITPTFTALGPYCVGATPGVLPATSSNGISGTWNPSIISTSTAGITTYTFTPTTGQCAINTTINVTVTNNITPTFTALGPYCIGDVPGNLSILSDNGISGSWNPTTINTSSEGTFVYTFTPSAGQCAENTTMTILVNSFNTLAISASSLQICAGQSSTLTASGFGNFLWNPGNLYGNQIVVTPNATTTYSVSGGSGCVSSGEITVNVYPAPQVAFTSDKFEGCEDLLVQFTDMSNYPDATWYWEFGDNTFSYLQNPQHLYTEPGIYDVSLTLNSIYGCSSSYTWNNMITVYRKPYAAFVVIPETVSELDPLVMFFDHSIYASAWEWNFGDHYLGNISNFQNPTNIYSDTGTYLITLVVFTDKGCSDTAAHSIYVEPNVTFYIPNAFTPNDDPRNPNFIGKGEGIKWETFEMLIFDRWGKQLFSTQDYKEGWNGEYNGTVVPEGIYVWMVSFTDIKLKKHNLKGIVTLIK